MVAYHHLSPKRFRFGGVGSYCGVSAYGSSQSGVYDASNSSLSKQGLDVVVPFARLVGATSLDLFWRFRTLLSLRRMAGGLRCRLESESTP